MTEVVSIRPMVPADIDSVLRIQLRCHDSAKQESAASFLSKLAVPVQTSFVAELGDEFVGYLVSVPVQDSCPLPLDDTDYVPPSRAVALYLHDLAVHPDARGFGVAAALIDAYLAALNDSALSCGCLTAVNDSSAFWQRHGFQDASEDRLAFAHLAAYGADARFMTLALAPASNPTNPSAPGPGHAEP